MSEWILIVFIVEFMALGVVGAVSGQDGLALYGIGGAVLNVGVMVMTKGG